MNDLNRISHIQNLLVTAFEGGSNYWYMIESHNQKEIPECRFLSELLSHQNSWMIISDSGGNDFEAKKITHDDVMKAFDVFSSSDKYLKHYSDLINGNDDADTGDAFLQLVMFGEVIFS